MASSRPANPRGEVPEWSNGAVSKTVERASVPRVRIPLSPPDSFSRYRLRLLERRRTFAAKAYYILPHGAQRLRQGGLTGRATHVAL